MLPCSLPGARAGGDTNLGSTLEKGQVGLEGTEDMCWGTPSITLTWKLDRSACSQARPTESELEEPLK